MSYWERTAPFCSCLPLEISGTPLWAWDLTKKRADGQICDCQKCRDEINAKRGAPPALTMIGIPRPAVPSTPLCTN